MIVKIRGKNNKKYLERCFFKTGARYYAVIGLKSMGILVDTIRVGKWAKTASGGYYRPDTGTITLNYHEDNETLRHKAQDSRETILYHEQKHRSNADKGFKAENINVSPKQYYKISYFHCGYCEVISLLFPQFHLV